MPKRVSTSPTNAIRAARPFGYLLAKVFRGPVKSSYQNYQAIFATKLFGYFLTKYFRVSSVNKSQIPKAIGKKKYSTGIDDERIATSMPGIYKKIKMTTTENRMAGKSHRFCVSLLNAGGCWNIESLLVLVANRLNHCMMTRLTK